MLVRHAPPQSSTRMVKGLHRLTLEKYSLWKGIGAGKYIDCDSFTVGGHEWAIAVFPDIESHQNEEVDVYLGLRISLLSGSDEVCCGFEMTLLDQSGKGNHLTRSWLDDDPHSGPLIIPPGKCVGYPRFMKRSRLLKSSYLKDDCLKIECTISVVLLPGADIRAPSIAGPRCDGVGVDFRSMLDSGEGCDVVFRVGGEKFRGHKFILSARSSVFEFMFANQGVTDQQELVITSMEPRVFKALLHFIYSDTLPEDKRSLVVSGYAFGPTVSSTFGAKLLAAADEYDLKRLKSICEDHLWRTIPFGRFAEILLLAERCNASGLKHMCFKYAADNYADLVGLDNFNYLRESCPSLLKEMDDYAAKETSKDSKDKRLFIQRETLLSSY